MLYVDNEHGFFFFFVKRQSPCGVEIISNKRVRRQIIIKLYRTILLVLVNVCWESVRAARRRFGGIFELNPNSWRKPRLLWRYNHVNDNNKYKYTITTLLGISTKHWHRVSFADAVVTKLMFSDKHSYKLFIFYLAYS